MSRRCCQVPRLRTAIRAGAQPLRSAAPRPAVPRSCRSAAGRGSPISLRRARLPPMHFRRATRRDRGRQVTDAAGSVLASFGKGIVADQAAVLAALTQPWSNGQTEGQITKLKLVKRQMYGQSPSCMPIRAPDCSPFDRPEPAHGATGLPNAVRCQRVLDDSGAPLGNRTERDLRAASAAEHGPNPLNWIIRPWCRASIGGGL
jgi:hypothetical protein